MGSTKVGNMKLLLVGFCFCQSLLGCSGQVIQTGSLAIDVFRFGLDIIKFIDEKKLSSDNGVVNKLKERISMSTSEIKTSIGLYSRLGLIDDAVINIHSSLADVVNIVQSNTIIERAEYIKLFVFRFEQNGVIKHVRFLRTLLTYYIPGASAKVIDLVADNNRCNISALDDFKTFYVKLLVNGISIDLLYLHLGTELALNKTIDEWTSTLEKVSHTFSSQQESCKYRFPQLAQEDVNSAIDADKFMSDNKLRYPWKTSDVIFLKPYGTFQFLYHKTKDNYLFWQKSSVRNKIAVFNDLNEKIRKPQTLVNASDKIKAFIEGESDDEAALHVGQAVEDLLKDDGYYINAIVVFFDGGDLTPEKIIIDEGSPAIQLTINDVKLRYCYQGVLSCVFDTKNWSGSTKEVIGKMRVFAYVNKADKENTGYTTEKTTYKTGSGIKALPLSMALYCLLIVMLFRG